MVHLWFFMKLYELQWMRYHGMQVLWRMDEFQRWKLSGQSQYLPAVLGRYFSGC